MHALLHTVRCPAVPKVLLPTVLAGTCVVLSTVPWCRAGDQPYQAASQLQAEFAADIEGLAEWCRQRGLQRQAADTRAWHGPRDPYKLYVKVLPEKVGRPGPPADSPAEVLQWHRRLERLRRDHADALYGLARRVVRRRASLAYELALAAIAVNPDHEALRRLFGYRQYQDRWHTVYAVGKLRAGQVRHEKFGWLPASRVRRYEQGQRYYKGRWITAEKDAELHRDIRSGWDVDTEHYTIRTNHSLEAGVALGVKLERLHRLWQQIFIRYYASEAQVVALFEGRARSGRTRRPRFHVVYFRDRDDYNRSLKAALPNIEMSIGVYLEKMGRAYFFASPQSDDRTLYHEATHQLFHQSRPVAAEVGKRANFWIVEGIAMYMETLHREGDYYVLGGVDDVRMNAARYRLLNDDFYVPLAELTGYGMERIQSDRRIATLYSQAAGLTNFLIYYEGGRYRDALVAYLSAVYSGRDTPDTLAQLTGQTCQQLDRQYREFVKQMPGQDR